MFLSSNRAASVLEWYDRHKAYSTFSSNEEEIVTFTLANRYQDKNYHIRHHCIKPALNLSYDLRSPFSSSLALHN